MVALEPSPGTLKALVLSLVPAADVTAGAAGLSAGGVMATGEAMMASGMDGLADDE